MSEHPQGHGSSPDGASAEPHSRGMQLAFAILLGVAVTGFVVGVRAGPGSARVSGVPEDLHIPRELVAKAHGITTAQRYNEIGSTARGVNAKWHSDIAAVVPKQDKRLPLKRKATKDEVLDALTSRTELRAFDGAPPVVPHPTQQRGALACLACHGKGVVLGNGEDKRVARVMSHRYLTNCVQCHVEQLSARWGPSNWPPEGNNTFEGMASPTHGPRAYADAPPQMPHSSNMRSDCASCHGPLGPKGLQTSHYQRQNCVQCHTSSAEADQRIQPGFGPLFPVATP